MKVSRLVLNVITYGKDVGGYDGYIEFTGDKSEVKIGLSSTQAILIMEQCFLALSSQAESIYANLLADLKALPCPTTSLPTPSSTTEDQ